MNIKRKKKCVVASEIKIKVIIHNAIWHIIIIWTFWEKLIADLRGYKTSGRPVYRDLESEFGTSRSERNVFSKIYRRDLWCTRDLYLL